MISCTLLKKAYGRFGNKCQMLSNKWIVLTYYLESGDRFYTFGYMGIW